MKIEEIVELNKIAKEDITFWIDLAGEIYKKQFTLPAIRLSIRGVVAGRANFHKWLINLNPEIFAANQQTFRERTIPHEVAHLIARSFNPYIRPHGAEWKKVMRDLGIKNTSTCHDYETQKVWSVKKPYIYACACREHPISPILHRRMQTRIYRCKICKSELHFVKRLTSA